MSNEWRRVVAALSSPEHREAYARAVLGEAPSGRRTAKLLADLQESGLLDAQGHVTDVFSELLAAKPVEARHGVQRWIKDGRIEQYPAKRGERRELLGWVAARLIGENEIIDEKTVNERLAEFTDDVAVLRRYLVDAALLSRDDFGRHYRKVDQAM
ncbi:MAG: DUF2087 domain-containing protein [Microbacteriaceae bacterium]|nr:DUF2087 domain-containing protein [Microbacteriaceae bacterium]